ncbi:hypothetical protein A3I45_00745 [Candidatus Uhrbacteria bacterium RIFCSPLOWO2_02_FULL_53_10]|uniref:Cob(I)yrinic acid a,c-diamide adenosyltransferase n=1 Tax=Candidatus Uhrbacteria bacterium RIFCSPLOWO2_02_FULL_53_10 TaxID=1802411 RepID=A0A1F7VFS4_9BACT|nr:MAG: hypothetical protein A3I45_00745 [Candidatus Uhrbacteria bacterium RIFCSPLOWO2_02_FULL_53_10]
MAIQSHITRDDRIVGRRGLGLIQLFEGHGKGKTTAALGEALRAVGAGFKVAIVFFDKGGPHYAERDAIAAHLYGAIDIVGTGRDRIDPVTGRFDFSVTDEDKQEAERGLAAARTFFHNEEHQLVILDEINSTVALGMLNEERVLELLNQKPDEVECILTGRNAPESFKERAHLVTCMELKKHYFYSGVPAREGIDL